MDDEKVRRVRAAGAYAGMYSEVKLAATLGISKDTLRRIFDGSRSWRELEMGEDDFLARVAAKTGVPVEFFTADFDLLKGPGSRQRDEAPGPATRAFALRLASIEGVEDALREIRSEHAQTIQGAAATGRRIARELEQEHPDSPRAPAEPGHREAG